jgi:hypothetical protein
MKQYLGLGIILIILIGGIPLSGFSLTSDETYSSGYTEGCSDGHKHSRPHSRNGEWAANHATVFMSGYYDGHRDCQTGTENWMNLCNQIQWALTKGCGVYVNPDNTLTEEGVRAKNCIINGALLSGGDILTGKSTMDIIGILKPQSDTFGCSNIVNWDFLQTRDTGQAGDFLKVLGVG